MIGSLTRPRVQATFAMCSAAWASATRRSWRSLARMLSGAATPTAPASGDRGPTVRTHSPTTTSNSSSTRDGRSRRRTTASKPTLSLGLSLGLSLSPSLVATLALALALTLTLTPILALALTVTVVLSLLDERWAAKTTHNGKPLTGSKQYAHP